MLGGGVAYVLALAAIAWSPGLLVLLAAAVLLSPASGAFVGLGQATLIDLAAERREQPMARWNLAGSVGVLLGPLALSGILLLGLGWRVLFAAFAGLTAAAVTLTALVPRAAMDRDAGHVTLRSGLANALRALRRREVLRWLILLEAADLLLDILLAYLALYFVDVVRVTPARAALAVTLWTGASLLGSVAVIPLLRRVSGLRYLRGSALLALLLFPAFLLAPGFVPRAVLIALLALVNAGWYPTLKGRLYDAMPEQSGTVLAAGSIAGLLTALMPVTLGLIAQRVGLAAMLWLLVLAPVILLLGVPRGSPSP